jgi:beta-glucosidase
MVTSFPFGHGLSYSDFEYGPISCTKSITVSTLDSRADLKVAIKITNTGKVAASEVEQIYVSDPVPSLQRSGADLKGFRKVWLQPAESATVTTQLNRDAWAFWDEGLQSWAAEAGEFEIRAAASANDVRSTAIVQLGETVTWRGL